ncbi:MAG: tRNA (adenosine(37)-N6)-threonylcarbamoyltransferase complex dimerization subunit type 1 TsaB [Culicoidibacterales bacterium]
MVTLFIDTATDFLFFAIVENDTVIDSVILSSEKKHSDLALYKIQEHLNKQRITIDQIERICIGAGPGSYSGIRIARTIANMVKLVRGVQCYQFSTLEFLHKLTQNEKISLHAGKNQLYVRLENRDQLVQRDDDIYTIFDLTYTEFPEQINYDVLSCLQLENIEICEPYYIKDAI